MREILFRGKPIGGGEFIYGHYTEHKGVAQIWIGSDNGQWNYLVSPETVGQFTGLTDKNGKKIFEGDIIKHYNRDDNPTSFDVGRVFWDSTKCRWLRTSQKCDYNPEMWSSSAKGYVIIGNIHDNPELLEVTDNA